MTGPDEGASSVLPKTAVPGRAAPIYAPLVPTFPYCAANSGCDALVTNPSPYFDARLIPPFATGCEVDTGADVG